MTSYQQKQKALFDQIESAFRSGKTPSTVVEPVDNYENDDRICLTSVSFVPNDLQSKITSSIMSPLKGSDQEQYYYPTNSLHLTIQNIRTVNTPPLFTENDIETAKKVFSKVIPKHPQIEFKVKGIFELPTSLSLRAYSGESLKFLCQELRKELKKSGIPDNKHYASDDVIFGNISVVRYIAKPNNKYFKKLQSLRNKEIGNFTINTVSLITTNSVCHPKKTKIHGSYNLK